MRKFPDDFIWGVATSAIQIEGRQGSPKFEKSIWDVFSENKLNIKDGSDPSVACDHYNRYKEDIKLMADLGLQSYRMSLNWTRLFDHKFRIQEDGVQFYKAIFAELKIYNIKPLVTLYHWELPQYIQDMGGWANRETIALYETYCKKCFELFSPFVDSWITFNEPFTFIFQGCLFGRHAPGLTDRDFAFKAVHHVNLASAKVINYYHKKYSGNIGITFDLGWYKPATLTDENIAAAQLAHSFSARLFTDPILGKGYPENYLSSHPDVVLPIESEDMEIISSQKLDFLGINYYSEKTVISSENWDGWVEVTTHHLTTDLGWPITPGGLFRLLTWTQKEFGPDLPLYITENGCAYDPGITKDGRCHDLKRIDYMHQHFVACLDALDSGVNLKGYYLWTLLDNFEWAEGYASKFGIVSCSPANQKRILKDSYYYYRDVISGYGDFR